MSRTSGVRIFTGSWSLTYTNLSTHISENLPKSVTMSTPHGRTLSTSPWPPGYNVKIVGGRRIVIWKEEVEKERRKRLEKKNGISILTLTSSAVDDTDVVNESDDDLSEEGRKIIENKAEKEATSTRPEPSTTGWGFRAQHVRFFKMIEYILIIMVN